MTLSFSKSKYFGILFFLNHFSFGQFNVIVDPIYEPKVRASLELIKETDASYYCMFNDYCSQIRITNDSIPNQFQDGIIQIPLRLISGTSLNNISCWIVNQTYRLRMTEVSKNIKNQELESLSHKYEAIFKSKLPREYSNSFKDRLRKFFDNLIKDPYENQIEENPQN